MGLSSPHKYNAPAPFLITESSHLMPSPLSHHIFSPLEPASDPRGMGAKNPSGLTLVSRKLQRCELWIYVRIAEPPADMSYKETAL